MCTFVIYLLINVGSRQENDWYLIKFLIKLFDIIEKLFFYVMNLFIDIRIELSRIEEGYKYLLKRSPMIHEYVDRIEQVIRWQKSIKINCVFSIFI
jgi:hypothetical protein